MTDHYEAERFPYDITPEALIDYQRLMAERAKRSGTFFAWVYGAGPAPAVPHLTQWVCEQHPSQPWPHDDCTGPGMPPQ